MKEVLCSLNVKLSLQINFLNKIMTFSAEIIEVGTKLMFARFFFSKNIRSVFNFPALY